MHANKMTLLVVLSGILIACASASSVIKPLFDPSVNIDAYFFNDLEYGLQSAFDARGFVLVYSSGKGQQSDELRRVVREYESASRRIGKGVFFAKVDTYAQFKTVNSVFGANSVNLRSLNGQVLYYDAGVFYTIAEQEAQGGAWDVYDTLSAYADKRKGGSVLYSVKDNFEAYRKVVHNRQTPQKDPFEKLGSPFQHATSAADVRLDVASYERVYVYFYDDIDGINEYQASVFKQFRKTRKAQDPDLDKTKFLYVNCYRNTRVCDEFSVTRTPDYRAFVNGKAAKQAQGLKRFGDLYDEWPQLTFYSLSVEFGKESNNEADLMAAAEETNTTLRIGRCNKDLFFLCQKLMGDLQKERYVYTHARGEAYYYTGGRNKSAILEFLNSDFSVKLKSLQALDAPRTALALQDVDLRHFSFARLYEFDSRAVHYALSAAFGAGVFVLSGILTNCASRTARKQRGKRKQN